MELILEVRELIAAVRAVHEFGTVEDWKKAVRLGLNFILKYMDTISVPPVRDNATFAVQDPTLLQFCDKLEEQCALAEAPVSHGSGGLVLVLLPIVFDILKRLLAR